MMQQALSALQAHALVHVSTERCCKTYHHSQQHHEPYISLAMHVWLLGPQELCKHVPATWTLSQFVESVVRPLSKQHPGYRWGQEMGETGCRGNGRQERSVRSRSLQGLEMGSDVHKGRSGPASPTHAQALPACLLPNQTLFFHASAYAALWRLQDLLPAGLWGHLTSGCSQVGCLNCPPGAPEDSPACKCWASSVGRAVGGKEGQNGSRGAGPSDAWVGACR